MQGHETLLRRKEIEDPSLKKNSKKEVRPHIMEF